MWKVLDDMPIQKTDSDNTPSADDFYKYFSELTQPSNAVNFSNNYENEAKEFMIKYDTGGNICASPSALELQIINDVFTIDEIKFAIDSLKNNKVPGIDGPAEIVKYCHEELIGIIVIVVNYMIEKNFPIYGPSGFVLLSSNHDPDFAGTILEASPFSAYLRNYLKKP